VSGGADPAARPTVRTPEQAPGGPLALGVTVSEMLGGVDGSRGLQQRRLGFAGGAALADAADGLGEAWYVIGGSGSLEVAGPGGSETVALAPGTAVWLRRSLRYSCRAAAPGLEIAATTVRAGSPGDDTGPTLRVARLDECEPERTGDREFRVLLSSGLAITLFVGLIPPGRAPAHSHGYDEVVHVLAGRGVVHLGEPGPEAEITPGTSIYLPVGQPHCLENTGREPLRVLGVFHPSGSPASKQPGGAA
jgi:mannose-6-phosphate isomerase-like protein (cupin superfamily)